MHDDSYIADSLRNATPDAPPPTRFDVDAIIRDGRRLRRRNRIALGGASAAGVLAVVGAIAMVISLSPATPPAALEDAAPSQSPSPSEQPEDGAPIEDTAMAGYPWTEAWNYGPPGEQAAELGRAASEAFGELLVEGNIWEESQLGSEVLSLSREQRAGNYGQVFTRQYHAEAWGDQYAIEHPVFYLDVLLPGGWTAEPGPVTDQLFPRHLIGRNADYTEEPPAFDSTDLDDGRTVMAADHGCAYDVVVIYPNGTALQLTWEVGCQPGTEGMHPVDLQELIDAALAMPEIDYDASELEPVEELWDVPHGWPYDPSWESDAAASAEAAGDLVREIFAEYYPDATVASAVPTQNGVTYRGSTHVRAYRFDGSLPLPGGSQSYEMRYYLPGGWLPGWGNGYHGQPYLVVCRDDENSACEETERDGRTVVTEVSAEGDYEVVVFHDDGWAASIWIGGAEGADMALDEAIEVMLALPAPPYDTEAVPEIPTE